AEPGRGLSKALSETGAVPGYVAEACVRALAERILYDTITWGEGAYTITPLEKAPDLPVRFDRSNASLILEGLRRSSRGSRIDVAARATPALASDLLLRYQSVILSPGEAELLSRVDGHRTAEELTADSPMIARLAALGILDLKTGERDRRLDGPQGITYLNVEISGVPPSPRAAEQMEQQASLVWNTYRRLDWASHYDILGIERASPPDQVIRALHERARLFHPDNHLKPTLGDAREALESLFKRVRAAEQTLLGKESRGAYDATLANEGTLVAMASSGPTVEVQQQMAKANYLRARALFDQEDFWPAFEMVRQSIEFDGNRPEYWILLSRIQRKNPKWVKQSTDTMRRAVERMPASAELWLELAEACQVERNEPDRVKALKQVLAIDPANRRAQSGLAEIAAMKPGK
ncbi:MAG TPA: DnaJ domain-containing protein, partial [Thermoanaerobaculia bacterium]|nr:DnaJ domain-containing protein [Thermoanaerobaculia bacterium]